MKKHIKTVMGLFLAIGLYSCSDSDKGPGRPEINIAEGSINLSNVLFGDSLHFAVGVSDADNVPLSTLKARLYYSDDLVSETVIRTKSYDEYSGAIYIPYLANVPNGEATLKFVLQNVNLTITEQEFDLPLTRPDYPYLTLVTSDKEYKMERVGLYNYEVTTAFPSKVSGYIKTPQLNENSNEMTFGWDDNKITEGVVTLIAFSNSFSGEYTISFNSFSYEATPFIIGYTINGAAMSKVSENRYKIDLELKKGDEIVVGGIDEFNTWWIDQDFFSQEGEKLSFKPMDGSYRITADFDLQYLRVETLKDGNLATLQSDGTGAIWIIGDNIGKPSLGNTTGWDTSKGICMAPIAKGKYRVTLVAGKNVTADSINFKFFYQRDWGSEFKSETLTTTSDIVFVGDGKNGRDSGNLGIIEGKELTVGKSYQFTIDVTAGLDKAVLTVDEI